MLKKLFQREPAAQAEIEKNFITYWELQRTKGKWKFAFRNGVLTWALPVFVVLEIIRIFTTDYTIEIYRILISLIVWSLAGFFGFGLAMWWWNQKSYQQLKTKNPDS